MAEDLEIRAYASAVVLAEVLHKLMLTEAAEKFGIKPHDVVRFLKRRAELISELKKCERQFGRYQITASKYCRSKERRYSKVLN
ncbi:Uncharacterised protein [uncultured archaeon]|nr:Uncharacterised protein [uncultured archaeon]